MRILPATRIVWPESPGAGLPAGPPWPATLTLGGPGDGATTSIVLDFGEEVYGGLHLEVRTLYYAAPGRLRVRLGESVSEAFVGSYIDRDEKVVPGTRLDVGVSGFRFARVDVVEPSAEITATMPVAHDMALALPCLGSFRCDDPRLDRVWEVGARTARLCMQDTIWDGIKRGQTVWAGDLHPAIAVIAAAYGPDIVVGASLDQLRDRTRAPHGPPDWMNGIPAYSLWWILCQAEWYRYAGDLAYLEAQREYLGSLLDVLDAEVDDAGREHFEGWRYLDWATTHDPAAIHAGYQGLLAWALRSALALWAALGDPDRLARCSALLARVESYRPPASACKQARALMVLGGLADAGAVNRHILAPDPAAGLTPFLGYHVLEARARADDHRGALGLIRDYWGAMIDKGATTFWEDFDTDWLAGSGRIDAIVPDGLRDIHAGLGRNAGRGMSLSLCHAWSAGPTAWLSRHVLGIEPAEPGCRSVRVRPRLGDLSHAEGTFPTPHGVVAVRHRRRPDGSIKTEVEEPGTIEVVVEP